MNMLQAIRQGAEDTVRQTRVLPCPFCGAPPPLAARIASRVVLGCENEDCAVNPQVAAASSSEAWAKWNSRAS